MRLALVSDLHANLFAFEAVLADAKRSGFDQLVCLGDLPTLGPRPHELLARIRELGCPCIMGNHDQFMLQPALVRSYSEAPVIVDSVDATRETLSDDELAFIRTFVPVLSFEDVFLYHGTPRSNMEDLLADTPPALVDEMLGGRRATVLAGGHTHVQMLRQHRGMLIVNPGSLGQPFREYASGGPPVIMAHAEYAIVDVAKGDVHVDLRRVALDKRALAAQAEDWDNPLAPLLRVAYA